MEKAKIFIGVVVGLEGLIIVMVLIFWKRIIQKIPEEKG